MGKEPNHPTRNVRYLRPQQEWKEIIAIYLYLAGMGAGAYVIGTVLNWFIQPSRVLSIWGLPFDSAKAAILWGPLLVAIGAPFLILDLGIKRRFLYACLNPRTSWVARGFLILSIFIVLGVVLLAKSALPLNWFHAESPFWIIAEAVTLAFAFATALYTGILLKATKSVPLWNTSLLPLLFLVSALSTGSMAIILSVLGTGLFANGAIELKVLIITVQILIGIEGVVLYLYLSVRYRVSEQGRDSVRFLLLGHRKFIFWGGDVLLGLILPFILLSIAVLSHGKVYLIFIAGLLLLGGGFSLRLGVLHAGIKDRIPMFRLMEIQYELIKNPKSEYRHAGGRSASGGKSETN